MPRRVRGVITPGGMGVITQRGCWVLHPFLGGFQPAVQPGEEGALPQHSVLRLEHPVVLVGEDEQFGRDAAQFGSVEGSHGLVGQDAVVPFAVDAEDGRVPLVHKLVGRVGEGALGRLVVLVPVSAAHVPVGKPFLFRLQVLHLHVEDAVVGDEGLEAAFVVACHPVDGEAAEAGAHASQVVTVYEGFFRHLVDGRQQVLHALAAVVAADGFVPLRAESRHAAPAGGYDDVVVGRHHLEVPAVAPELAQWALRAAFAIEQGGVFLLRVELGRVDDPYEHVLLVGGLYPALLHASHLQLVVDVAVLLRQLAALGILVAGGGAGCHDVDFVGLAHAVARGDEVVAAECDAAVVVQAFGQADGLFAFTPVVQAEAVDLRGAVPRGGEVEGRVRRPDVAVHVGVETGIGAELLVLLQVEHVEAVAVALVAVAGHALPGDVASVGRELRVGVVALVLVSLGREADALDDRGSGQGFLYLQGYHLLDSRVFAEVKGAVRLQVIEIDVRVGGHGIGQSRLLAAGVGNLLAVGAPCQLLDAAERFHGAFVGFAFQQVADVADFVTVEVGHEGMGCRGGPLVPMLVHQVVHDDAACLGQVGVFLGRGLHRLYLRDEEQLLAVGAEGKALDASLIVGQLAAVRSVGVHLPHLARAALVAQVGQLFAFLYPYGLVFLPGVLGQLRVAAAVGVHQEDFCVALVLRYTVIAYGISHFGCVGRYSHAADAPHGPQGFGRQPFVLNPDVRAPDEETVFCARGICTVFFASVTGGGRC